LETEEVVWAAAGKGTAASRARARDAVSSFIMTVLNVDMWRDVPNRHGKQSWQVHGNIRLGREASSSGLRLG
jgi:hypothetical protein